MKVPNCDLAMIEEEKITKYLLNPLHPDGAGKAKFFVGLGFRVEQWQVMAVALRKILMD